VTSVALIDTLLLLPLTVFGIKGVPGRRRECKESAVVASGNRLAAPDEC
jgi:hypothetical protein